MNLKEAQDNFIQSWGALGSNWGVSKTMAQIHALLLISSDPVSADDVMNRLGISRGNANMNLRALIDWGLVERVNKLGERKEFFVAEKDMWKVTVRIANERRKRELQPILKTIEQARNVQDKTADQRELAEFSKVIDDLGEMTQKVDKTFNKMVAADEHWFTGTLLKLIK